MSNSKVAEYHERMLAAQHAIQSGVAFEMSRPDRARATEPKHLRVGINTALLEISGVAKLLIDKGVISEEEYFKAMAEAYEAEARDYEKRNGVSFA